MNERIQELITECETEFSTSYEPCYDMEKFAELIVKECSKISTELCTELKADESIQTPGSKISWNLYMITLRNKLSENFEIDVIN